MATPEHCSVRGCRRPVALKYIDDLLCQHHWEIVCRKQDKKGRVAPVDKKGGE